MSKLAVEIKEVFTFEELPEEVQYKVIAEWRQGGDYAWQDENVESLNQFENEWPIRVKGWEYSPYSYSYINFDLEYLTLEVEEMTGLRLAKWIINNHWHDLYSGKYYGKVIGTYPNAKHVKRYSKVIFEEACPTGYYMGYDIRKPIYDFLKKPCNHTTLEDIMQACLNNWLSACVADLEWQDSKEYITNEINANEYEFTADGKIY